MNISRKVWGRYQGRDVYLFRLDNGVMDIAVSSFGAGITEINLPGLNGEKSNVVLHYDNLQDYVNDEFYVGCVVGRVAGRVSNAKVLVDGIYYELSRNGGKSLHLHGGYSGFNKKNFSALREHVTEDFVSVELYYRSVDLEEGYPGNLDLIIIYKLDRFNQFTISYKAVSDHDTPLNLTNHSYFNFGDHDQPIDDHEVFINADRFVATDGHHIPTGKVLSVENSHLSFVNAREVGSSVDGNGYNHCYVLNAGEGVPAASVFHRASGRSVTLETDFPALLFYTGDYLKGGFKKNAGLCLETQFYPDSSNQPGFPDTILRVGEVWEKFTRLKFGW